jgi:uncharacterized membrane protein YphA (DoxX/SURF4 family)
MKARKIGYWVATALLAVAFLAGGVFDLGQSPAVAETLAHLGYPAYLATLLGTWKVLGALAVLAPGLPRLKEWAYAGMMFDLTGALVSHAAAGDGADKLMAPIVLLGVLGASWALRPETRKLGAVRGEAQPATSPRELKWAGPQAA